MRLLLTENQHLGGVIYQLCSQGVSTRKSRKVLNRKILQANFWYHIYRFYDFELITSIRSRYVFEFKFLSISNILIENPLTQILISWWFWSKYEMKSDFPELNVVLFVLLFRVKVHSSVKHTANRERLPLLLINVSSSIGKNLLMIL